MKDIRKKKNVLKSKFWIKVCNSLNYFLFLGTVGLISEGFSTLKKIQQITFLKSSTLREEVQYSDLTHKFKNGAKV